MDIQRVEEGMRSRQKASYVVSDGSEDLVYFADLLLILEIDGRVEEGHRLLVGALEDDHVLARMHHLTALHDLFRGSVVLFTASESATASATTCK